MPKTVRTAEMTEDTSAAEMAALDTLLEDLDLDAAVEVSDEDEIVEELVMVDAELDDEALRGLDGDLARDEIYAETESEIADVDTSKPTPTTKAAKAAAKKAKGVSTPKAATPRVARDLNSIEAVNFVLEGDIATMSDEDKDAAKVSTMAATPTQKKIAEKHENLFLSLAAGRKPSVFVTIAFALLDKNGTLGASDLIAAYKANDYSQGTAASQAGQIMHLFDVVKIATRAKSVLTTNPASVVADRLRAVMA